MHKLVQNTFELKRLRANNKNAVRWIESPESCQYILQRLSVP